METNYDLVIIGGGPAGITAGIYSVRQRIKTLLITKNFGGQMARKAVFIENYPGFEEISGTELIKKFENHLKKQNIEVKLDSVVKIKKEKEIFSILTKEKKEIKAKAIIVASGADPRPLEVSGEKEFIGKGVSYCVACDGPIFSEKDVVVVGGGNAGLEAALFLSNYANKIYILERGENLRADEENQKLVKEKNNIEIITGVAVKEIKGDKFVNSLIYQEEGKKEDKILKIEGIFIEIGSQPATSFIKDLVDFNKKDEIIVDCNTGETKTPGLFAAGDITSCYYKQIVIAAGEGAKAAWSAANYLQKRK